MEACEESLPRFWSALGSFPLEVLVNMWSYSRGLDLCFLASLGNICFGGVMWVRLAQKIGIGPKWIPGKRSRLKPADPAS